MPVQTRRMYKACGMVPTMTRVNKRKLTQKRHVHLDEGIAEEPLVAANTNGNLIDLKSEWSTVTGTSRSSSSRRKLEAEKKKADADRSAAEAERKLLRFEAEYAKTEAERLKRLAALEEEVCQAEARSVTSNHSQAFWHSKRQAKPQVVMGQEQEASSGLERCQQWVNSSEDPMDQLTRALATLTSAVAENKKNDLKQFSRQHCNLDLPSFYGDPEEWAMFYTSFIRSSEQLNITDDENIRRLQKCLRGKAKDTVRSMLMSSCSLRDIMDTLEKRFGRPKVIINTLLEKAKNVKSPKDGDQESIIDFSIAVKNLCSTAKALQQHQYLHNPQLIDELVRKLPDYLKLDWGRFSVRIPEYEVNLEDFSKFLDSIATAIVRVSEYPGREAEDKPKMNHRFKGKQHVLLIEDSKHCILGCKQTHELAACEKFKKLNVGKRWEIVKESKLCFSCLAKNHTTKDCLLKNQCKEETCSSFHHYLLHRHRPGKHN